MIKKKELQYPLDALEPYYTKETLDIHYNILYAFSIISFDAFLSTSSIS